MATEPTTTTYALLGLLSMRPWNAYDLTQQMRRALRWAWPRSEANLYNEAKRLVRLGYAKSTKERYGKRTRTVYEITDAGQEALRDWLAGAPVAPPQVESEALLRVFFADQGTAQDLREAVDTTRGQIADVAAELVPILEEYARGEGPFPERMHLNMLFADFVAGFYRLVDEWCDGVEAELDQWGTTRDVGETAGARERLGEALGFYRSQLDEESS